MGSRSRDQQAANDSPEFIYVRSARGDNRVALHEVSDEHPGGSVLVAGDKVWKVADTALVRAQLRDRQLEEVKDGAAKKEADRAAEDRRKAFEAAGMAIPSEVAGDRPVVNEGRDPEGETGDLGGGLADPSRAGTGAQPTEEEKNQDKK